MAKCKRNRNRSKRNFTVETPTTNRNYKDTVFRMLFSDRKNLLSLYNAVNQSDFIEFYNGSTAISDCTELRLSSAFEHLSGEPKLELIVTVLNVNEGHNAELMQHCSMLKEYAQYVARVPLCVRHAFKSGCKTCCGRMHPGRDSGGISCPKPK